MRSSNRLVCTAIGLALAASTAFAQEQAAAPASPQAHTSAAYESDPAFMKAVATAMEPNLSHDEKLARWTKANEVAGGQCMRCFRGIIDAEFGRKSWKDAVASSRQMDALATDADDKFYAEASLGRALVHGEGGPPTLQQLGEADKYLHMALAYRSGQTLLYVDGEVLATLGRTDEARAAFELYVKNSREMNAATQKAQAFAQNPESARLPTADGAPVLKAATPAPVNPATPAIAAAPEPAYASDPKFEKAVAQAKAKGQTHEDRLENWKHANKIAGGQCIECLHQMIQLQASLGAIKDEVKTAEQLEAAATDNPHEKYFAETQRGMALMAFNYGQPKPEQVSQAEAAFRDVLAYSPKSRDVAYQEGRALAMQGKTAEAKAMFDRFVEMAPASDRYRARAERFSDDPHLATLPMAPPFRLVTSDGQEMQLDEMNGRVVLLDFWATWCGPCKETLPEMQKIARDYANDPTLVIISVSSDQDKTAWRAFLEKNNMNWPQYRDSNGTLSQAYGVTTIPRFFTIDTNGVLKSEQVGSGADVRSVVTDLVKKAHKAEAQRAKAATSSGQQ